MLVKLCFFRSDTDSSDGDDDSDGDSSEEEAEGSKRQRVKTGRAPRSGGSVKPRAPTAEGSGTRVHWTEEMVGSYDQCVISSFASHLYHGNSFHRMLS